MKRTRLMKKTIGLVLAISTAAAAVSGCSTAKKESAPASQDAQAPAGDSSKGDESAAKDMSDSPEVVWKISHTQAPDHFMNTALENLSAYVSENTGGKFKIEVYHSGTLGSEQEVIEGMQMGTIAGNLASVALLANFVPSYNVFSLPGIFKDEEAIKKIMSDEELMAQFKEKALEQNIMEIGYFEDYFRMVFSKKPIKDVADFEGQKIRVMSSPVLVDTFQALGCNATTTAWSELYSGLQLGVVDGLDHVSTSVKSMNFFDHVKYMSDVKIFATPMFLVISKPLYDKLPEDYKKVLDEGMKLALEELNSVANDTNAADIKYLEDEGGVELIECDVDAIHKAIAPVRDKYIQELEPWAQDVAKKIMETE